jgi:PEP-CTERM motif
VFTVTGILGAADAAGHHTLTIGVADTNDSIYSSGVFISGLAAGTATGGGGIGTEVPAIPEPSTYALMLGGLGAVGWMARRRRQNA